MAWGSIRAPWRCTKPLLLSINKLFPTPYVRKQMNGRTAAAPQTHQKKRAKRERKNGGYSHSRDLEIPQFPPAHPISKAFINPSVPTTAQHHQSDHPLFWPLGSVMAAYTGLRLGQWVL